MSLSEKQTPANFITSTTSHLISESDIRFKTESCTKASTELNFRRRHTVKVDVEVLQPDGERRGNIATRSGDQLTIFEALSTRFSLRVDVLDESWLAELELFVSAQTGRWQIRVGVLN